jgi:NADPH:quinone reductase-like Zn-dependent oxidoreductase
VKALAFDEFGGPDKLRWRDVPDPKVRSTMSTTKEFNDVMRVFFAGRLMAIVDEVMPLEDGAAAQARLADGKQFGKIVLSLS